MLFLKYPQTKSAPAKGFVFVLEAAIALVLFLMILQAVSLHTNSGKNSLQNETSASSLSSALSFLDENGYVFYVTDQNISADEKITQIHQRIVSLLPNNYSIRTQMNDFEADLNKCKQNPTFNNCFTDLNSFSPRGEALPTEKEIIHQRIILAKKSSAKECSIGAIFAPYTGTNQLPPEEQVKNLFFSSQNSSQKVNNLFFAGYSDKNDLNISFNVSVTPPTDAECGQTIRADLNATISAPGRYPADIMLVQDKSGSMSWDGLLNLTDPRDLFVLGNYVFVADGSSGLRDINILNPLSPNILGTYNSSGTASGVYVSGNTAYLADGSSGLNVVNVTNKSSPSSLGSINTIGASDKVFTSGNYAYVVTTSNGSTNYLDLEVTGTTNTSLTIGKSTPNGWAGQSFVPASNTIYAIGINVKKTGSPSSDLVVRLRSTLQGADIATATISRNSITTSYAWYTASFASNISLDPTQAYYIVLTTASSSSTKYYSWAGITSNPYAGGNSYQETSSLATTDAFFRTYHRARTGLNIIDVSTPASLVHKSSIAGSDPNDIFVLDNYAFFSDGTSGVKIIDITTPTNPIQTGSIATTNANGIFVEGNTLYVADGSAGLRIINVTNKSAPSILGTYNTPGTAYDVYYYSDGNVYVADDSALISINVTNPAAPSLVNSFSTPFNYQKVQITNNFALLTPGYNSGMVSFSILTGPKIDQAKESAVSFIDNNGWKEVDKMGIVSFSTSTTTDQTLLMLSDTNKTILKNKMNSLVANGSTAIGDAILAATTELSSSRVKIGEYKFQVLLSDGQSNSGSDPIAAAQDAATKNIKIYTIGFGSDADEVTLESIASITDANYYKANDINALQGIYALIATDIGEYLSMASSKAYDSNIVIPVDQCDFITNDGNGICTAIGDKNYLVYNISLIDPTHPWADYYEMNIPCDNSAACKTTQLILPGSGTSFNWSDSNHSPRDPFVWDTNKTINFKYKDLGVTITNAFINEDNRITLDANAYNSGLLSTPASTLDFYLDDPNTGTLLKQEIVPTLNAAQYTLYLGEEFTNQGWIYAIINKSKTISECPGNNIASIYCTGSPRTQYYVLDVWMWGK
ncbi:MAG: VWA domain-containing protein [archaeon]|jgi:hypothetical protein